MPQAIETVVSVGFLLLGFAFILGAAYWATKLIGRSYAPGMHTSGAIRVLDRAVIGQDRMLCIVAAADKVLLIGVTAHSMETLAELDAAQLPDLSAGRGTGSFPEMLKSLLLQRTGDQPNGKEAGS